jgi:hypothetical protein
MKKVQYTAPKLNKVGSFEAITQATGNGGQLDANFAAGTPRGALTFS